MAAGQPEIEALIARRRSLGLDRFDEVWDGEYHMAPMAHSSHGRLDQQLAEILGRSARQAGLHPTGPFNLGEPDDFRVPDRAIHREPPEGVWIPTAAIVAEIESPDDETWAKLPFYFAHGVEEVLVVSAGRRSVTWLVRDRDAFVKAEASRLLGLAGVALTDMIDWPPAPA